ncbi:MAG: ferredoxin [Candidatus Nanoarchaeia archaeon]|nr:ferredoxin [Candidatus Nanoarchaeia archaeon]MDD5741616.1 ferredoxin [Candidatus Nanoarchaeia archaeon]
MVKIDQEKCIGCGSCSAVCEKVFEIGDDMKARVKKGQEKSKLPCVKEAIDICTVQAIKA